MRRCSATAGHRLFPHQAQVFTRCYGAEVCSTNTGKAAALKYRCSAGSEFCSPDQTCSSCHICTLQSLQGITVSFCSCACSIALLTMRVARHMLTFCLMVSRASCSMLSKADNSMTAGERDSIDSIAHSTALGVLKTLCHHMQHTPAPCICICKCLHIGFVMKLGAINMHSSQHLLASWQ